MDCIRVLLTRRYCDTDLDYMKSKLADNIEMVEPSEFTSDAITLAAREDTDALFGEHVSREILDSAKNLKLIQIPWTGVDRLDFDLLRDYDVPVCNSHSNAGVVSEYAVGLMMAVTKGIPFHDKRLRSGKWMRPGQDGFQPPFVLAGKTVGFLGYGAVARNIASILSGFNVKFMAIDARQSETPEPLDYLGGPEYAPRVMAESDIVFVTLPLTEKTVEMVNAKLLARMKPSAYIINVSRGEIVNEADLYHALKDKRIAGAAIDTWYCYPARADMDAMPSLYPFHELDNVVMSPHRAGFGDGLLPHLDDAIENLNRLATGRPLINRVDLNEGF